MLQSLEHWDLLQNTPKHKGEAAAEGSALRVSHSPLALPAQREEPAAASAHALPPLRDSPRHFADFGGSLLSRSRVVYLITAERAV